MAELLEGARGGDRYRRLIREDPEPAQVLLVELLEDEGLSGERLDPLMGGLWEKSSLVTTKTRRLRKSMKSGDGRSSLKIWNNHVLPAAPLVAAFVLRLRSVMRRRP